MACYYLLDLVTCNGAVVAVDGRAAAKVSVQRKEVRGESRWHLAAMTPFVAVVHLDGLLVARLRARLYGEQLALGL